MTTPAVPDLIQAVLGFRTWALDDEGWLLPFSLGAIAGPWRPGTNQATCHYAKWRGDGSRVKHDAPAPRCMCGLYGLADAHDPRLPHDAPDLALGAIGAWGDIEVHRSGFRAEYATVLALAVSPRAPARLRLRHERAARRYGVELVAPELLEVTGLRHAAPVPDALLPGGPGLAEAPLGPGAAPRGRAGGGAARGGGSASGGGAAPGGPRGRARRRGAPVAGRSAPVTPAGRGFRVDDHTWLDAATLRCGITRAFADLLGSGPVDLTLPSAGALHRTSDALAHLTGADGETYRAWTPMTAGIRIVNPALADDPGLLLADPEGAGWLATLAPTNWAEEAAGLEWGPRGAAAYRASLTASDPWADLRATTVHVSSAAEVLHELRRRRSLPRFADAQAVEEALLTPLQRALDADPSAAARVGRLGLVIGFEITDPATGFLLAATDAAVRIERDGPAPGLTLRLPAETLEQLLSGRLDVARALRSGDVTSDQPLARTLAIVSVLTNLPRLPSSSERRGPIRT